MHKKSHFSHQNKKKLGVFLSAHHYTSKLYSVYISIDVHCCIKLNLNIYFFCDKFQNLNRLTHATSDKKVDLLSPSRR